MNEKRTIDARTMLFAFVSIASCITVMSFQIFYLVSAAHSEITNSMSLMSEVFISHDEIIYLKVFVMKRIADILTIFTLFGVVLILCLVLVSISRRWSLTLLAICSLVFGLGFHQISMAVVSHEVHVSCFVENCSLMPDLKVDDDDRSLDEEGVVDGLPQGEGSAFVGFFYEVESSLLFSMILVIIGIIPSNLLLLVRLYNVRDPDPITTVPVEENS